VVTARPGEEWLVFFTGGGPRLHWWDWFLRPAFRHVVAARLVWDLRAWLIFDPSIDRTEILLLPTGPKADKEIGRLVVASAAVLRVQARAERGMGAPVFGCVAAVKALLGIRSWRALGPYGLYRQLLARGAEVVEVGREDSVRSAGRPDCEGRAAGG
jgi:hypothetical protein